jgi:hypothetical protein
VIKFIGKMDLRRIAVKVQLNKIKVSTVCPIIAFAGFFTTTQKILFLYI